MAQHSPAVRASAIAHWQHRGAGESLASVAKDIGVPVSTLRRWVSEAAHKPDERASKHVLQRLGRDDDLTAAQFARRLGRHSKLRRLHSAVVYILFGAVTAPLAALLIVALYDLIRDPNASVLTFFVRTGLILLLWVSAGYLIDAVVGWIFTLSAGLLMATFALLKASALLQGPLRGVAAEPKWWQWRQRWTWWRFHRDLGRAEALLTRRTVLGRPYKSGSAKAWELMNRRNIARSIGHVEVHVHLGAPLERAQCERVLDEIATLTLLREWSLDDLPQLPETSLRHESRRGAVTKTALAAAAAAATLFTLIRGTSDVLESISAWW